MHPRGSQPGESQGPGWAIQYPNPGLGHLYPSERGEPFGREGACAHTQGQHFFASYPDFTECRDTWGPFPPRVGLPSPPWACMRGLSRGLVTATAGAVAPSPASSSGVNKASGKGGLHNGVPRASGAGFPRGGPDSAGPGAPAPLRGSQAALGRALWWAVSEGGRAAPS